MDLNRVIGRGGRGMDSVDVVLAVAKIVLE